VIGSNCVTDSTSTFKHFFSLREPGLTLGDDVTLWRTALSVEEDGEVVIGDHCYLANASIVCAARIEIGSYVMVAGGVTIVDSDFHPVEPAARLADTVALSSLGDRARRPPVCAEPVCIGDDVWIGPNATVLKGVRIGAGAVVAAGALVIGAVAPGALVAGNPAHPVEGDSG
jgi:acetyltransferase-like isoleucine patch superfamily enzyme